jgi:hypothetical protein
MTLIANVNEVNSQPILDHPYTIICHLYNTMKINNLHNMWQLKKVWKFLS